MDGDVGTKLLFENERVKVWEITLAPGEETVPHTHELDHVVYPIETSEIEVRWPNGASERRHATPGDAQFRAAGDHHIARNVGDSRFHQVIVELK